MSIDRGTDKEDVVHTYNGILLRHKKEQNSVICSNMDGPRDCHSEKDKYMISPTCGIYKKGTNELIYKTETESQM